MATHKEDIFRIRVSDLEHGPCLLEIDCDPAELDLSDPEFRFVGRVRGAVRYELVGHQVVSRGEVRTSVETVCSRCLRPVPAELEGRVFVVYENNPELKAPDAEFLGSEDGSVAYFDGDSVHPADQIREALMVELPEQPLCAETCPGLCLRCGADLNDGRCACPPDDGDDWKRSLRQIHLE